MLFLLGPGHVVLSEQQTFMLSDYILTKTVNEIDRLALRTHVAPKFGSLARLYNLSLNIFFVSAIRIKSVKVTEGGIKYPCESTNGFRDE